MVVSNQDLWKVTRQESVTCFCNVKVLMQYMFNVELLPLGYLISQYNEADTCSEPHIFMYRAVGKCNNKR